MDTEIDPAEADQQDEAAKQDGDQIGSGFVFQIPTAEKEHHTIENQDGKGMATGKAVASLADQMERQIGPSTMKGNL